MLKVAITGGMGAGKSTVRELLQRRGAHGVDADDLARKVVQPGTPGLRGVLAEFGDDLMDGSGRLRRKELARRAFASPAARKRLEAILHPLIIEEENRIFAELELADPGGVAAVEVPLLAEAGTRSRYDVVVLVTASPETRWQRLCRGGRFAPEEAKIRAGHQARDEERAAIADFTLANDGTPGELEAGVVRLWRDLLARRG